MRNDPVVRGSRKLISSAVSVRGDPVPQSVGIYIAAAAAEADGDGVGGGWEDWPEGLDLIVVK